MVLTLLSPKVTCDLKKKSDLARFRSHFTQTNLDLMAANLVINFDLVRRHSEPPKAKATELAAVTAEVKVIV